MTKEQFYRKLLEAQIRGVLVGTYNVDDNLNAAEKNAFFFEAFAKGFFLKDDEHGTPYESMDVMLTDLLAGKKVLHLKTPVKDQGYFAFPADREALYSEFSDPNRPAIDPDAVDLKTTFKLGEKRRSIFTGGKTAPDGPAPAVPGGWWSSFWNRVVKTFTGHSSDAWKDYDAYQENAAMDRKVSDQARQYSSKNHAEPGSVSDQFTEHLLAVDRQARVERGELLAENAVIRTGVRNPEEAPKTKEEKLEERIRMQRNQEDVDRNQKIDRLKSYAPELYNDFPHTMAQYGTLDAALAVAKANYERENISTLNLDAEREIDSLEREMFKSESSYVNNVALHRSTETTRLISNNAYRINDYLRLKRNNPEFRQRVEAAQRAAYERCDEVGNSGYYDDFEEFSNHDVEMKLALMDLGIAGAENYKLVTDDKVEKFNIEHAKHNPPKKEVIEENVINNEAAKEEAAPEEKAPQASEEEIMAMLMPGEIIDKDLEEQISAEEQIRKQYSYYDPQTKKYNHPELLPLLDLEYDLERFGLTDDPADAEMALKVMRAQHAALKEGSPVPFLFNSPEEAKASIAKALETGLITKEHYDKMGSIVNTGIINDDEAQSRYSASEDEKALDERIAENNKRLKEQEEREAEEEARESEEQERRLALDEFEDKYYEKDVVRDTAEAEYYRLKKAIMDMKEDDGVIQDLGDDAYPALDRLVEAKFGLRDYDEEHAVQDLAKLIAVSAFIDPDSKFKEEYLKAPMSTMDNIAGIVRHNNMHKALLGDMDTRQIDMLLFRKNRDPETGKNSLSVSDLYYRAIETDAKKTQEARNKNVEESFKNYTQKQKAFLSDQNKVNEAATKLTSIQDLPESMAKEEYQLKQNATKSMMYLFSDVLSKPQDEDSQLTVEGLNQALVDIALYQSLQNGSYRKAYQSLIGEGKRKDIDPALAKSYSEKYEDIIRSQVSSSGVAGKILSDRAELVDLVFGKTDFFQNVERINMKKGLSISHLAAIERTNLKKADDEFKMTFENLEKATNKENAGQQLAPMAKVIKENRETMEEVCRGLEDGFKESKKQIEILEKQADIQQPVLEI